MTSTAPLSGILSYGPDEAQHLVLSRPAPGTEPRGIAALVHGGYWRSHLTASLMEPLAASLRAEGWITANIEYRRGAGGPWPDPLRDTAAALGSLNAMMRRESIPGPLVSVGHSVGGQLALLTARLANGVVALAPVTDVKRTYLEDLGDGAAAEYFGTSPAQAPETYEAASPVRQPLGATPTLILHGVNDNRVPIGHSRSFMATAQSQGSPVRLREFAALGHLEAIDPSAVHWAGALSWMANAFGPEPRAPRSESA
ncbi:S9 family peptidase [Paeniglutamicibacter sp. ABSL32-1]|uniref:alpha/beta hydrolase family protein n=1 Tax=Paeniglutamicibacter quisquiliarum TaxID=2849498 RepID=UPI001C2D200B|nr:alpha/beta fold hydrolase [Paeniglutamicibacter quisquiliarum]MBV1779017.1 S9 family peptidase [Paeniglutamicibacter quisquiliarum]